MRIWWSIASVALLTATVPALADGPTKQDCISLNENGQDLRRAGRLRAAAERFESCAATSCPGPLRQDCTRRLAEVRRATPTIVFVAKDAAGKLLTDVRVSMDDAPIVEHLDGSPVEVEPGEHTFVLASPGFIPLTRTLLVTGGIKGRREVVTFDDDGLGYGRAPTIGAARPRSTSEATGTNDDSTQRTIAYVVGGAGLAIGVGGVLLGIEAQSASDAARRRCDPAACADARAREEGNSARDRGTVATAALVVGALGLAGGTILYLTAPKSPGVALGIAGQGVRLKWAW